MLKDKFKEVFEDDLRVNEASPEQEMKWGKEIEKEHGTVSPATNITNDNPVMTAKIAKAHVNEIPDYYTRLRELEKQGKAAMKESDRNVQRVALGPLFKTGNVMKPLGAGMEITYKGMPGKIVELSDESAKGAIVIEINGKELVVDYNDIQVVQIPERPLSERILGEDKGFKIGDFVTSKYESDYEGQIVKFIDTDKVRVQVGPNDIRTWSWHGLQHSGRNVKEDFEPGQGIPDEQTDNLGTGTKVNEVAASPDAIRQTFELMKTKFYSAAEAIKATASFYKVGPDYISKILAVKEATHGEVPFDTFDKKLNEEIDAWKADYYNKLYDAARNGIYEISAVVKMSFMKNPQQKLDEIKAIVDKTEAEMRRIMDEKSV